LIQATIGCPHNKCTFCMVYKNGPKFRVRDVAEIKEDILEASDFIRLRTFVPKINTPLLEEVQNQSFKMLGPHEVLQETALLIKNVQVSSYLTSDHYTNYINLEGRLPEAKSRVLDEIDAALRRDEKSFRPFFIGTA